MDSALRYWVFHCASGPIYQGVTGIDPDAVSVDFFYPGQQFIDRNKFDYAYPSFHQGEWTTLIGFVCQENDAPVVARVANDLSNRPEKLFEQFPKQQLFWICWVNGWWEAWSDAGTLGRLINPNLVYVDTPKRYFFNNHCDQNMYNKARQQLEAMVTQKQQGAAH